MCRGDLQYCQAAETIRTALAMGADRGKQLNWCQFGFSSFNFKLRNSTILLVRNSHWCACRPDGHFPGQYKIKGPCARKASIKYFSVIYLIHTKFNVDPFQPIHVSKILAKLAEQEKADMIMLGKVRIGLKFFWTFPISFSWQLTMTATRPHKWQPPFSIGLRYHSKLVILPQPLLTQIPVSVCLQSNKDRRWSGSSQRDWRRSGNH